MALNRKVRTAGIVAAGALILTGVVASSAFATAFAEAGPRLMDGSPAIPGNHIIRVDATPDPDGTDTPDPTDDPAVPPAGEVSIDGPFATPTPSTSPAGAVLDATATPMVTPPATDVTPGASMVRDGSVQGLLLGIAGLCCLVPVAGAATAARRR